MPIKKDKFGISYHCFVPLTMNKEKMINHFILFCYNTGLLIKYDEESQSFDYNKLPICPALKDFNYYSFNECKFTLPMEIYASFAILSGGYMNIHIIGGFNAKSEEHDMNVSVNDELKNYGWTKDRRVLVEVSSNQMELFTLAHLTSNDIYYHKSKQMYDLLAQMEKPFDCMDA
ncbi:hypothetical protein RFI_33768 [Reticulomyxa filosa]|uniref:Uncharacterized protein n=1 Tax=Reticulomyxa filosa TaxID=46433 RepID=X6LPS2_RETFI|nr:hypothetical protein RFI_33768 [Reticulomyxa filosa]|eukprot:ETO03634.1 hypothetical protein RFI_33768 [Reticulomyxa filosa]